MDVIIQYLLTLVKNGAFWSGICAALLGIICHFTNDAIDQQIISIAASFGITVPLTWTAIIKTILGAVGFVGTGAIFTKLFLKNS